MLPGAIRRMCAISVKERWVLYVTVGLCLLLGMVVGSYSSAALDGEQAGDLAAYIEDIFSTNAGGTLDGSEMLRASAYESLVFFGALYLTGLSVIGAPVMLGLIFLRGFALGFTASVIIGRQGASGILIAAASLAPHNIIVIPAILCAGVAALSFSLILLSRGLDTRFLFREFTRFTAATGAALVVAFGGGLIEAFISPYLLRAALAVCTN